MTYHVVQIGDTHGRIDARSEDQFASLDAAIAVGQALAAARTLALWAWSGDLFHAVSEPATRNALFQRAIQMADLAPVVIVRGNHDLTGELDAFAWLKATYPIAVSIHPELLDIETPIAVPEVLWNTLGGGRLRASIWTMPYPNKAALVAAGTPPDQIGQVGRAALDGLMAYGAAELATRARTMRLVICHGNTVGAMASTGQPQIGVELSFDTAMFERFDAGVYIGLGHIHKHQVVGRAVYAGSNCRLDFGELEPKGVIVADFEPTVERAPDHYVVMRPDGDETALNRPVPGSGRLACVGWRFVPIDVPAMYHIKGRLTPEGFTFAIVQADGDTMSASTLGMLTETEMGRAAIASGAVVTPPTSWRGADVRVQYTYTRAELPRLNVALIHAEFAEARSLKIDAIPDRETEVRAPEVLAAVTMQDKLEAFAVRSGLDWSSTLAHLAATIETQPIDKWQADAIAEIATIGAEVMR